MAYGGDYDDRSSGNYDQDEDSYVCGEGYDYDDNSGGGSPSDSDDDYQEEDSMIHSKVSL